MDVTDFSIIKEETEDTSDILDSVIKLEEENEKEVTNHEAIKPNLFHIDRTLIQEVGIEQQDQELQSLGLSVYHQDELEQGILQQVDQALEMQEREDEKRRLDKQLKDIADDIRCAEQQLTKDETLLRVMKGTAVSVTHAFKVRKDQEMRRNQLTTLRAKEKTLLSKKTALESGTQEASDGPGVGILKTANSGETEQERMIRLGEMTPFGTILAAQLMKPRTGSSGGMTHFEKYFNSQAALEKSRVKAKAKATAEVTKNSPEPKPSTSGYSKHKSPLKSSVLNPQRKRKLKEALGSKMCKNPRNRGEEAAPQASETQSMWLDESDPDFMPEEYQDEDEEFLPAVPKKKTPTVRKVKKQRPMKEGSSGSDWHSDDSDWESSGDEKKIKRRRQKGKETDDGNSADYNARLKIWEKENNEEKGSHQLTGGLEVPKCIWNKLYKYQQVGVQWMWELFQNGTGGILGDEMGLGKTIQIIAFLAALKISRLRDKHTGFRGLGASIVVCPTTVMHQWVKEMHTWWPPIRIAVLHDSGSFEGSRNSLIREISQNGGVLVTSYQGLVKHQETLLSRSWHLIILDEGHKIRNPDAQATLAAKRVPTPHRLALTGSPMQNNLRELWSLFDFVYPSKLGTLPDFLANFAVPITHGGYANATEVQVATAYHCALSLKETIKPYLLRRMKSDVKSHICLPSKNEQVLFCKLTEEQRSLYRQYVDSRLVRNILDGKTQIFVGLINLRKICNHPDLFSGKNKLNEDLSLPEEEHYGYWERSGKMAVVQSLLKIWHKQAHRVLLFTQGRQMMCILEKFIQEEGYSYLKLDGTTSISSRQPLIAEFNNNPSHFVFLLTTRVGGLGVNLTGADRVVIFDPDWNPATDTQARERAWRIGQKNQVTIYRLVTAGTIEEKIYHRQIFKQFLSNKVLQDPRQRRFFKTNDLYELFTLKEGNENSTETSAIFAGTGSEVTVDTTKRRHKPRLTVDLTPQPVNKIEFSQEKIDHMKQLAQKLSQQFASNLAGKSEASKENVAQVKEENKSLEWPSRKEAAKTENGVPKKTESKTESKAGPSRSSSRSDESHKKHKKHKKNKKERRREKGAKFEGERIKHLAKLGDYAQLVGQREEEEASKNENQDDYVLRKLFKKSGLQTALKHDNIMEGGGCDYALVEREARHVAKEAMARLRESQRQCFRADAGVPTWTGNNGNIRAPREQSTSKPKPKPAPTPTPTPPSAALGKAPDSEEEPDKEKEEKEDLISGDDLLSMWNKRNRLLKPPSPERPPTPEQHSEPEMSDQEQNILDEEEADMLAALPEDDELAEEEEEVSMFDAPAPRPPVVEPRAQVAAPTHVTYVTEEETDLLDELRSYLSFGGSVSGQATTEELLARFPNSELPTGMAPLFKCLLDSLAEFYRNSAGIGVWKLKSEFR